MGITTPFFPTERTSLGIDVSSFSQGTVPNNPGDDVATFARFLRATKAPAAGPGRVHYSGCARRSALV
jgi:hypothetical protein